MSKLIGDAKPAPEALAQMKQRGGRWFAYQNHDMGHREVGHLQFMKCGEGCTHVEPPPKYCDTPAHGMGWRYLLAGEVDLETGEISCPT